MTHFEIADERVRDAGFPCQCSAGQPRLPKGFSETDGETEVLGVWTSANHTIA